MARGVDPVVGKKPLIRRTRRRRHKKISVVKKLVDYLRSDSYMFAPMLSSDFRASSSPSGVGLTMENRKGGKKSVGNYLNSDSHLYAPLFAPQHQYLSSKGNGVSQKIVVEGKQEKLGEIRRRISAVSGQVHRETVVKHMFNPTDKHSLNRRVNVITGKWLRKRLIE